MERLEIYPERPRIKTDGLRIDQRVPRIPSKRLGKHILEPVADHTPAEPAVVTAMRPVEERAAAKSGIQWGGAVGVPVPSASAQWGRKAHGSGSSADV